MRNGSPWIVPPEANQDTYLVLDDFGGRLGRAWRETDEEGADRETLRDLMDDQYGNPVRIVAFNTAEGWVPRRDHGYCRRAASASSLREFVETASRIGSR